MRRDKQRGCVSERTAEMQSPDKLDLLNLLRRA